MTNINHFIGRIRQGITKIIFPNVCLCCGAEVLSNNRQVCDFCLHRRFEDANPENKASSSGVIMPRDVAVQHALWTFDKGGSLQNLMHHLKYARLTSIGTQVGEVLGRRAKRHPANQSILAQNSALLLPVPLHYLKFKKRGFNQAFYIARGVEHVLQIPICPINAVVRKKYTRSQTGFTLQKRIKNMKNAFAVPKPDVISGKTIIIIDDVFTTGSTSFELAKTLSRAGAESILIWTVAQA